MAGRIAGLAGVLVLIATTATAQVRRERGFISINGGVQVSGGLRDTFEFEQNVERGSMTVEYPTRPAGLFDAGAGLRVWRRVGLGVGLTRIIGSGRAEVAARVPHPFFDERHRSVEGEARNVRRAETAVHVQVFYELARRRGPHVRILGGPSFITADQDLVHNVEVRETFPFDTAEFARAQTRRGDGSGLGAHLGVDLSWPLTRRLDAGALVRYSYAPLDVNAGSGRSVSLDAGGLQASGGLRIVF